MDARYTVDTPENIEFAYDVAGIGSRFLAAIIDTSLLVLLQLALLLVISIGLTQAGMLDMDGAFSSILIGAFFILSFIFLWGYYILFELFWNGQSPGKRAIGLRVVREGGRPITFVSSAIRNLIRFIDFLPGFYGIGVVMMFIDPRARRLGDLAAGTLVVKERQAVSLDSLTAQSTLLPASPRLPDEPAVPLQFPNVHLLTTNDYNLIQEFLRRRNDIGRESRMRLSTQLATNISTRLGVAPGANPEVFLEQVVHDYRLNAQQQQEVRLPNA